MSRVARTVALALAEQLGHEAAGGTFPAGCDETTCFLRLNRYPACPFAVNTLGLVPHTDSDFLTVLCQDQVGGLQLMMDSRWVAVKPRPDALIVNIGDLFQVTVLVRPAGRCHSSATTRYRAIAAAKHLYVLKFWPSRSIDRSTHMIYRFLSAATPYLCVDYMFCHLQPFLFEIVPDELRASVCVCVALITTGVEQQQVQERGAQGGGQRQVGALLRSLFPVPVVRLARGYVQRAVAVQGLHLPRVPEEGAGRRQEDRQKDRAPQLSQTSSSGMRSSDAYSTGCEAGLVLVGPWCSDGHPCVRRSVSIFSRWRPGVRRAPLLSLSMSTGPTSVSRHTQKWGKILIVN
jgi:hypothetical protein